MEKSAKGIVGGAPAEGPNDERRRTVTKRDGIASEHLHTQAAAMPQDELAAGLSGQPESIHTQALLAQVLERANLQRALKQVRQNKGASGSRPTICCCGRAGSGVAVATIVLARRRATR